MITTAIEYENLTDVRLKWALPQLKDAQKAFNKYPTATNWRVCLRAMLVYQQLGYIAGSALRVDTQKLWFDLESNPIGVWADVICRATIGLTCDDALNQCK